METPQSKPIKARPVGKTVAKPVRKKRPNMDEMAFRVVQEAIARVI